MTEQRTVPRWRVQRQTTVRVEDSFSLEQCGLEDMSFKGMCLSFSEALPVKPLIKLVVSLMDGLDIDVIADVRWTREVNGRHVYGMAFNRIKDTDKEGIYQYLHKNFKQQWDEHWWTGTAQA